MSTRNEQKPMSSKSCNMKQSSPSFDSMNVSRYQAEQVNLRCASTTAKLCLISVVGLRDGDYNSKIMCMKLRFSCKLRSNFGHLKNNHTSGGSIKPSFHFVDSSSSSTKIANKSGSVNANTEKYSKSSVSEMKWRSEASVASTLLPHYAFIVSATTINIADILKLFPLVGEDGLTALLVKLSLNLFETTGRKI